MRTYTFPLTPAAATVALDLFELTPADDIPIEVHSFRVWQTSDVGDAQEEVITLSWIYGNTTSGSGGNTSVTGGRANPRDAAASVTCESGNTTAASSGTAVTQFSDGWNVRIPYSYIFIPEDRPSADQGNTLLVLRMGAAPADSLTIGASVTVAEKI